MHTVGVMRNTDLEIDDLERLLVPPTTLDSDDDEHDDTNTDAVIHTDPVVDFDDDSDDDRDDGHGGFDVYVDDDNDDDDEEEEEVYSDPEDDCVDDEDECSSNSSSDDDDHCGRFWPYNTQEMIELTMLLHGPHPISRPLLQYIWYLLEKRDPSTPSIAKVQRWMDKMPGYQPPTEYKDAKGTSFYALSISQQISQVMATPDLSGRIARFPVRNTAGLIRELYEGREWNRRATFCSPMIEKGLEKDDNQYFIKEFVWVQVNLVQKLIFICRFFIQDDETSGDVKLMVEGVPCYTEADKVLFEDGCLQSSCDNIVKHYAGPITKEHVGWLNGSRLDETMIEKIVTGNELRAIAGGRSIVTVPITLFSDDVGGNVTKKWCKFGVWTMTIAALPSKINNRLENQYFLATSQHVNILDLAEPIVKELRKLETEGQIMFDANLKEEVLVVAPLFLTTADNDRASELVNHLGCSANLFCSLCTVHKTNAHTVGEPRTKKSTSAAIHTIRQASNEAQKRKLRKQFGVSDRHNPLFELDSFSANPGAPMERLHTILLGPYKSLTMKMMKDLTNDQQNALKREMTLVDWEPYGQSLGNLKSCSTFFGRDFKLLAQVAPIVLPKILSAEDWALWKALSQIFIISYGKTINPADIDDVQKAVDHFITTSKQNAPELMRKLKTHKILHLSKTLLDYNGPMVNYCTERQESFLKYVRERHSHSNRHNASRDIATGFAKLQHLRFVFSGGFVNVGDGKYRSCGQGVTDIGEIPRFHKFLYQTQERVRSHDPGQLRIKTQLKISPGELFSAFELLDVSRLIHEEVTDVISYLGVNDISGKLCRVDCNVKCNMDGNIGYGKLAKCALVNLQHQICMVDIFEDNRTTHFGNRIFKATFKTVALKSLKIYQHASFIHMCKGNCTKGNHDTVQSNLYILNKFFLN